MREKTSKDLKDLDDAGAMSPLKADVREKRRQDLFDGAFPYRERVNVPRPAASTLPLLQLLEPQLSDYLGVDADKILFGQLLSAEGLESCLMLQTGCFGWLKN